MPNTTALLVPIKIDAWVVNAGVNTAPSAQGPNKTGRTIQQRIYNFNGLAQYTSPEAPPFFPPSISNTNIHTGIYVKWTLPAGLSHAVSTADDNTGQFPAVPTRWLVARTWLDSNHTTQIKLWVVESNAIQNTQNAPGSPPSAYFPNPEFPHNSSTPQIILGRALPLAGWRENSQTKAGYLPKLTAVASGDPSFATFQPYNNNVFSYYDNLTDNENTPINTATVSYFVAGWYADDMFSAENALLTDPLALLTQTLQAELQQCPDKAAESLTTWLAQLNQTYLCQIQDISADTIVNQATTISTLQRLICHGFSSNISWDLNGEAPSSTASGFDASLVKCAFGNSTAEALAALVTNPANNNSLAVTNIDIIAGYEKLLAIYQLGQLSSLKGTDEIETLDDILHSTTFNSIASGTLWKIVPQHSLYATSDTLVALPAVISQQLDELNQQQLFVNQQQAIVKSLQWQLYALWWKNGWNNAPLNLNPASDLKPWLAKQLSTTSTESFYASVLHAKTQLAALCQEVALKQQQLADALVKQLLPYELKSCPDLPFYEPVDPVMLVTNVQAPILPSTSLLKARLLDQVSNSINYLNTQNQPVSLTVTSLGLPSALLSPDFSALPGEIMALWQEFLLLDYAIKQNSAHVQISSADNARQFLPDIVLAAWAQPWSPLFLEWKINWYPVDQNNWRYDSDTDIYQLANLNNVSTTPQTLYGRTLIRPQARNNFIDQLSNLSPSDLAQIIDQAPDFTIQTLKTDIQQWDILSQRLEGFQHQLAQKNIMMQRTPSQAFHLASSQQDETESKYAELIENEACLPPTSLALSSGMFQPVRQGQFSITNVNIIDSFGQCIIVPPQAISISPALQPTPHMIITGGEVSMAQLSPRILQPLRLNFNWLSAEDDGIACKVHSLANPVCGWLLPKYLGQSIQVYAPEGQYLGEIGFNGTTVTWATAGANPYTSLQELVSPSQGQPSYRHLGKMLLGLQQAQAVPPTNNHQAAAYPAFLSTLGQIADCKVLSSTPTADYLTNFVAQPLALVRASWQFEYAGLPDQDQSLAHTTHLTILQNLPLPPSAYPTGSYSLQLGNLTLRQDGVIGYFTDMNYQQFYSVCPSSLSSYILPIGANLLTLPLAPLPIFMTLLLNPRQPLHAYTDILPVFKTTLPAQFTQALSKPLTITFELGPLLSSPTLEAPIEPATPTNTSLVPLLLPSVTLSKPLLGGTWSWLQRVDFNVPPLSSDWQFYAIQNSDTAARFATTPPELNEGWLNLTTQALSLPANKAKNQTTKQTLFFSQPPKIPSRELPSVFSVENNPKKPSADTYRL